MTDVRFNTALIVGAGAGLSAALARALTKAGIKIASLTSPDNNLQAVFRYLTEEKRPQAGVQS